LTTYRKMAASSDPFVGSVLEGMDTQFITDLCDDCDREADSFFLAIPLFEVDGRAKPVNGLLARSCCAGAVLRDAYICWFPTLPPNTVGFIVRATTINSPEQKNQ